MYLFLGKMHIKTKPSTSNGTMSRKISYEELKKTLENLPKNVVIIAFHNNNLKL